MNQKLTKWNNAGCGGVVGIIEYDKTPRVFYITKDAVSRHESLGNLEDCLCGEKQFDRDAFIFTNENAQIELEANVFTTPDLDDKFVDAIETLGWSRT